MNVIIKQGDTFASLAARYTNVPEMADAIALHNGVMADDGVNPWNRNAPIPLALGTVEIPDEWLTGQNETNESEITMEKGIAIVVVVGIITLLLSGKHH